MKKIYHVKVVLVMFFCATAGGKERKRLPISYYLSGGSKNDIAKRKNR